MTLNPPLKQKKETGVVTHVYNTEHSFDFDKAKIVYETSSLRERHIVESALICLYSRNDRCVNLNNGFSPQHKLLSHYVVSLLKQRNTG